MPQFYSHLKYVAIELTNVCNLKCKVCWSQSPTLRKPRKKGYMTQTLFQKVLVELAKDAKFHSVALHYAGESTLHPQFELFSNLAHNCGFGELTLATNGTLLDEATRQTIIRCYDAVAVSLHNTPHLKQAITNLKLLLKEAGVKARGIRANIVIEEFTATELYQLKYQLSGYVGLHSITRFAPTNTIT
jgi:molybdenum cofactor biosynthesis enzyme MoaA